VSAREQLEAAGHEAVIYPNYFGALDAAILGERMNDQFDADWIDLMMPAEPRTLGTEGERFLGEPIGVGYPLAMKLAQLGIKMIIVVSDVNHHDHPAAAMFDWLIGNSLQVDDSVVMFQGAKLLENGAKDWCASIDGIFGIL